MEDTTTVTTNPLRRKDSNKTANEAINFWAYLRQEDHLPKPHLKLLKSYPLLVPKSSLYLFASIFPPDRIVKIFLF
ncbi:MAG: hypothetical protein Ct9H90mP6_06890 [Gammaproteobacteria bacterium]|nr:MAG: hypothetical protein Ct9H90mP6_06890 [Gammaproteobacteria bacterium]